MNESFELLASVIRGKTTEALHFGAIVVVDANGRITHSVGDPDFVCMTRSAIKPFQAMPLIMSGGADKYQFVSEQIAIMCGSHNGSDRHKEAVTSILETAGNSVEDLQCGAHWPLRMQEANRFPEHDEHHDRLRNNCSGKHAGFLALCKHIGEDTKRYIDPQSQTQQMIKKAIADFCEYDIAQMPCGIDGCSAPNYPLSLFALARGYVKLVSLKGIDEQYLQATSRIREAMLSYPFMVSGERRFDYNIAQSFQGRAISKVGAEAVQVIALTDPEIAVVVKVADGNFRALGPICLEVLRQLRIVQNSDDFPLLKRYIEPEVKNVRNIVTGTIRPEFQLREV